MSMFEFCKMKSMFLVSGIILLMIGFLVLNSDQTVAQSASAYCVSTCPGGCAMTGYEYQSCGAAGCYCSCEGGFMDEYPYKVMTEYDCSCTGGSEFCEN